MRITIFLTAVAWVALIPAAMAQVSVTPGSVDAPFVHVDWWGGRVHVCAPFVNLYVDRPGCCAPAACGDDHVSHGPQAWPAPATAEQARQQLAFSGEQLYNSLGRFSTAEKWRHFLAVAPDEPLATEQLYHINSARAAKLKTVLENFDSAAADEQYGMISSLPAFERTRGLLAGYLARIGEPSGMAAVSSSSTVRSSATEERHPELARHWSPASTQPHAGLPGPGAARDIARPGAEELPSPPVAR